MPLISPVSFPPTYDRYFAVVLVRSAGLHSVVTQKIFIKLMPR